MTVHRYASPEAFKQALEQRLRAEAGGGGLARQRQLLVFDRFLARATVVFGDAAILKGGLALERRVERARTTKDVDLRMIGPPEGVLARLQEAARRDLGDFMTFEIGLDEDHPGIVGTRYEGSRYRAECRIAGKLYGQPFGVDVAFGDPILGEPDVLVSDDHLAFAAIPPPSIRIYPIETHIAEKLHAYTMPRSRPNSRVKDLPDLALLATAGVLDALHLRAAIEQTFAFRDTHAIPNALPEPSTAWAAPYAAMAREDRLAWPTIEEVTGAAQRFLDPVLAGGLDAAWAPARWAWRATRRRPSRRAGQHRS